LTLIEVVVSLGLLSTLLVGILVAYHRHAERIRTSQQSLIALDGIDRLMCDWASQGISTPCPARGELPGEEAFTWRTETIKADYQEPLGIDVVRLAVFRKESSWDDEPIVSIDLAVQHVEPEIKNSP
jgi:type II secretory pathway component PulJ